MQQYLDRMVRGNWCIDDVYLAEVQRFDLDTGFCFDFAVPPVAVGGLKKDGDPIFYTLTNVIFRWNGIAFFIPVHFPFDGASIPKITRPIAGGTMGPAGLPALGHDWLYNSKILSRIWADQFFREALRLVGENWFSRETKYLAVRVGGCVPWETDESSFVRSMIPPGHHMNPWTLCQNNYSESLEFLTADFDPDYQRNLTRFFRYLQDPEDINALSRF